MITGSPQQSASISFDGGPITHKPHVKVEGRHQFQRCLGAAENARRRPQQEDAGRFSTRRHCRLIVPPSSVRRLNRRARELTWIGNNLQIRHSETSQERLAKGEHVDYLFHRLLAFIQLGSSDDRKRLTVGGRSSGANIMRRRIVSLNRTGIVHGPECRCRRLLQQQATCVKAGTAGDGGQAPRPVDGRHFAIAVALLRVDQFFQHPKVHVVANEIRAESVSLRGTLFAPEPVIPTELDEIGRRKGRTRAYRQERRMRCTPPNSQTPPRCHERSDFGKAPPECKEGAIPRTFVDPPRRRSWPDGRSCRAGSASRHVPMPKESTGVQSSSAVP